MPRPTLSLCESQLTLLGEAGGSHDVFKVAFRDHDGQPKIGFRKLCSEQHSYLTLSAKYVVAFSILVRAALGQRGSEERLLYNTAGKIIGTVSLAVPNFVPLLSSKPTIETLIENDTAAPLMSKYKHKDPDCHSGNIGVMGAIDNDELYDPLIILKGKRYGTGYIFNPPKISAEEILNFPCVDRVHWPTNTIPKNMNLYKAYPTETIEAFRALKPDTRFIKQKYIAILKELLAFDKKVLAERMKLYLGDEKLDLDELPSSTRRALVNFGKPLGLFYDAQGKERGLIDHCLLYLESENNHFKREVLSLQQFRDFMLMFNRDEQCILSLKKWFVTENAKNPVPHDLRFIEQELHSLWRACFTAEIDKKMELLNKAMFLSKASPLNKKNEYSHSETSNEQLDTILLAFIKPDVINETGTSIVINQDKKMQAISRLRNEINAKIQTDLVKFNEIIVKLIKQYFEKPDAIQLDNHIFIDDIKNAINKNESNQKHLKQWLVSNKEKISHDKELEKLLDHLLYDLNAVTQDIEKFNQAMQEFLERFRMNPAITYPIAETISAPQKNIDGIPNGNHTVIEQLSKLLSLWIKNEKESTIKKIIHQARTEDYNPSTKGLIVGTFYSYFRTRGENTDNMSLTEIFSEGNWYPTSLNTLIIKKLCMTMLMQDKASPYKKSIYDKIITYDDTWWGKAGIDIAIKSHLKSPTNKEAHTSTIQLTTCR